MTLWTEAEKDAEAADQTALPDVEDTWEVDLEDV